MPSAAAWKNRILIVVSPRAVPSDETRGKAAVEMVQTFLTTAYLGGRHQRRLDKIARMEGHS